MADHKRKGQRNDRDGGRGNDGNRAGAELDARIDAAAARLDASAGRAGREDEGTATATTMEARLAEMTARCRQLESTQAAVQAAAGQNGRVMDAIVREMRLPLRAVLTLVEPLSTKKLDARQKARLAAARSSLILQLSFLDGLEDLAAVEAGRFETVETIFDVHRLLGEAAGVLQPIAVAGGLDLELTIDPAVPRRVSGDPDRLRQLLLFVTAQALSFAAEGAVTLCATLEGRAQSGPVLRFSMHNAGEGVPVEQIPRLLDPVSPPPAGSAGDGDLRLGLAMYHRVIESLGGRFGVEAIAGGGYAVWFTTSFHHPGTHSSERHNDRLLQEMLDSSLGPIIDLSTSGVRVLCRRPPKGNVNVTIVAGGRKLKLKAAVVWRRRLDSQYVEAGLRFLNPAPDETTYLHDVALHHAMDKLQ